MVCFLNLGSHIFFAGVVTAIFTGNPYFTLLAGVGSFIPDLDREYLFVSPKGFRKDQYHRALFHNLLFLSGLFFVNVWLALGAFLHSFIDSFTTDKDKGVEWLFPFSRLVKRGRYTLTARSKDGSCNLELVDQNPPDRVCFLNEDSPEATKLSDPDLKESRTVPWRRTYGPVANGQLFDRWLFVGSFSLLILYALVNPDFAMAGKNLHLINRNHSSYEPTNGHRVDFSRRLAQKKQEIEKRIPRSLRCWWCVHDFVGGAFSWRSFELHIAFGPYFCCCRLRGFVC